MATLKVSNFGPIKDLKWEIEDYSFFIGPQASGKSTIAKLVYYFLSLKDDVSQYVIESVTSSQPINIAIASTDIKKKLRSKFVQLFGTTKHLNQFEISFQYKKDHTLSLSLRDGYVDVRLSVLDRDLSSIFHKTNSFIEKSNSMISGYATQHDLLVQQSNQRMFYLDIEKDIDSLFGDDDRIAIYVPACRGLLSTLSDYIYKLIGETYDTLSQTTIPDSTLDYSSKAFIDRIMHLKKLYSQSLDDIIKDKQKFSSSDIDIDQKSLLRIKELIPKILKGEYRYSKEEERLYYNETDYVKLSLASSGQQEAVWILQLIFYLVLNNTKTTLLIEEPEAHLFPEAQMNMVYLISFFAQLNGNRIIITTHSPYILSTVNNLLYASKIGAKHPEKASKIIPSCYWIDYNKIGAYYIDKGSIDSLLEDNLKQIKAERIDEISDVLNREFDNLLQIDDEV